MDALTREQKAFQEYVALLSPVRHSMDLSPSKALPKFVDAVIHAEWSFIAADAQFRLSERCRALGLDGGRGQLAHDLGQRYNERGLFGLSEARSALKDFDEESDHFRPEPEVADLSHRLLQEAMEQAIDVDLSASELKEILEVVRNAFDAARTSVGLRDFLRHELDEFEHVRRRPDMGINIGNPWPIAKVIFAAIILGGWVWNMFHCAWNGTCYEDIGLSFGMWGMIVGVMLLGC